MFASSVNVIPAEGILFINKMHLIDARQALHEDLERNHSESCLTTTADMQKALSMPKLSTKDYFFSRKLVLFNICTSRT